MVIAKFSPETEEHCYNRAKLLRGYPHAELVCYADDTSTYTDDFTATALINVSSRASSVYLGYRDSAPDERLVLKVGRLKAIKNEGRRYRELADLQGSVIPRMVACLRGPPELDMEGTGVLILEHAGTALQNAFSELPRIEQATILDKLARMHNASFAIDDFANRNVLRCNENTSDFRLIDFETGGDNHRCLHKNTYYFSEAQSDSLCLSDRQRMCPMVMTAATSMGFWHASYITIEGRPYLKSDGLPTDPAVLRALKPTYPKGQQQYLVKPYYQIAKLRMDDGESVNELCKEIEKKCMIEEAQLLVDYARKNFTTKRTITERKGWREIIKHSRPFAG